MCVCVCLCVSITPTKKRHSDWLKFTDVNEGYANSSVIAPIRLIGEQLQLVN